jgi:hypothetical protein
MSIPKPIKAIGIAATGHVKQTDWERLKPLAAGLEFWLKNFG